MLDVSKVRLRVLRGHMPNLKAVYKVLHALGREHKAETRYWGVEYERALKEDRVLPLLDQALRETGVDPAGAWADGLYGYDLDQTELAQL